MSKCDNCEFKNIDETCYSENNQQLCEAKNKSDVHKKFIHDKTLEKKYPPLKEKIFNFSKSLIDLAQNPTLISQEKHEERLSICNSCEWFDKEKNNCKKCGCYIPFKVSFETFHCPLDPPRW